ncbi:MAG TPA: AAA family ATPase [Thermoanaerobaculia bacterium]|jgi:predicted ATPase|nr:AAA family ATPase [Thermoanaerobaculia bacterium]
MQELALLLGIVVAEWIVLYPKMTNSTGYFWPALKRTGAFLTLSIAARWAIGWILLRLSLIPFDSDLSRSWVWGFVAGLIVVALPSFFEHFLDKKATTKFVSNALVQLLLRFNLLIGQTLKSAIQKQKEQDNYDYQRSKGWWDLGLPEREINRRLRMLYELVKLEIASYRHQPELLRHDVNISPGQKFYLLVAYLGRKGLRRALETKPLPPPPGLAWDGSERRRKVGIKSDRRSPDPNHLYSRIYDNEELRNRIAGGKALGNPSIPASAIQPEETLPIPCPPDGLLEACLARECLLYVGAGLSTASGYPTWVNLVGDILDWAIKKGHVPSDLGVSLRAALREGDADLVADVVVSNLHGREELLQNYLKEILLKDVPLPSRGHRLLREIPFVGALTTNFDELLEATFSEERHVYTPEDTDPLREDLASRRFFLLKLYGSLRRPSTLLVSPAQYRESIAGNRAFSQAMEGLFFSRTIFFIGASLQGIEAYLDGFTFRGIGRRQHYALVAVSGTAWRAKADLLDRRYGIQVIPYKASTPGYLEVFEFLSKLRDRVEVESRQGTSPDLFYKKSQPLTRIRLENIGAFEELDLELDPSWTLLLGDNGVGKTTVLKAIAVAISGKDAEPFAGRLIRTASRSARIVLSAGTREYMATLIAREEGGYAEIEMTPSRPLEAEGWLAIGFPPLRTTTWGNFKGPGPKGKRRPTSEDLLPLVRGEVEFRFDELKQWIVNLDYWSKDDPSGKYIRLRDQFFEMVRELTEGVSVRFSRVDKFTHQVWVETDDGEVPIEALSQGTASLMGWTGFLLERLHEVYDQQKEDPRLHHALVLIDEIDAHMHPAWQQALVERLTHFFKGIQFVASTHSPFIASSLTSASILRLRREEKTVTVEPQLASFKGWRVDQTLTSPLFDLETGRDSETQRLLLRYTELAARNNLSEIEQQDMQKAAATLEVRMPNPAEREEAREAFKLLEDAMRQQIASRSIEEQDKILAEARVQLQEAITGSRRPQ